MAIRAVKAQAMENQFNSLLITMGLNVDEAVGKAIAALLHSNSHIVAGVMESAVAIQELELKLDQAVFSALEQSDLPRSEVRRMTSIVNISKDLARLGKLAANLGRKVTEVGKHNEHEDFSGFSRWPSPSPIFAGRPYVLSPGWTWFWRAVLPWAAHRLMLIAIMCCATWKGANSTSRTSRTTCISSLPRAVWSRSQTTLRTWRRAWWTFSPTNTSRNSAKP